MKLKNRIDLAEFFRDQGFKKGAEIGVCDGRYSDILMRTIKGLYLIGIDPYTQYDADSKGRKQAEHDEKLEQAKKRLAWCIDAYHFVRKTFHTNKGYQLVVCKSTEAAKLVADESLDFVFIDGNHAYEFVKEDIEAWYPKVRSGGIVSGHDYYEFKSGKGGVVKAVDEFVAKHGLDLQTTEWDNDAHPDDRQPDWYFVKP